MTDHVRIRAWAEARKATPACVRRAGRHDASPIRLDFPGYSAGDSLEDISWDEWFARFDQENLALVIQEETADGQRSHFNTLVSRDGAASLAGAAFR